MSLGGVPLGLLSLFSTFLAVSSQNVLSFSMADEHHAYAENKYLMQTCEANVNVTHIQWLNPEQVRIGKSGRIHVEDSPPKEAKKTNLTTLIFKGIEDGDEGNYTCVATLPNKEIISKIFRLKVLKPIKFVDSPEFQSAAEGYNVTLQCKVEGFPVPTIIWKPKSAAWISNDRYCINGSKFEIINVSREDTGEYRCTALQHNKERSDFKEMIIKFAVKYKPEWKPHLKDKVYSFVTGTVNMTCESHGVPTPTFAWIRNDKYIVVEPAGQYVIINSEGRSTLEVFVHNESCFGNYKCEAQNELGAIEHEIELKLGDRPTIPDVTVRGYQPSSVELDITSEKKSELNLFSYRVEYKEPDQEWTVAKYVKFEIGAAYVIKGLKESTAYVLRVAAENAAGIGNYTADIPYSTLSMKKKDTLSNSALSLQAAQGMDVILNCIFAAATFAVAFMV